MDRLGLSAVSCRASLAADRRAAASASLSAARASFSVARDNWATVSAKAGPPWAFGGLATLATGFFWAGAVLARPGLLTFFISCSFSIRLPAPAASGGVVADP